MHDLVASSFAHVNKGIRIPQPATRTKPSFGEGYIASNGRQYLLGTFLRRFQFSDRISHQAEDTASLGRTVEDNVHSKVVQEGLHHLPQALGLLVMSGVGVVLHNHATWSDW